MLHGLQALPMSLLREEEFSAATFSKWSQKYFSETDLCGQRVRKMISEGMGSVIPIKVAERDENPESGYAYSAGESCPKKVMAPQRCKNSEISPPINPRKNASKATPEICKMKNLSTFFDPDGSLQPGFSGVSRRRGFIYGREEIIYGKGIAGDSSGQQTGNLRAVERETVRVGCCRREISHIKKEL